MCSVHIFLLNKHVHNHLAFNKGICLCLVLRLQNLLRMENQSKATQYRSYNNRYNIAQLPCITLSYTSKYIWRYTIASESCCTYVTFWTYIVIMDTVYEV